MSTIDTNTRPILAEAMTARELRTWEDALRKHLGTSKGDVGIGISMGDSDAYVCVRLDGICGKIEPEWFRGATFPEAILAAQTWIANRPKVELNAIIRKLALAIIELTDEHGKCTVAMLRAKNFDEDEIALHAESCQRASEMCANAPFIVEGL